MATAGLKLPELREARYSPCWALMLALPTGDISMAPYLKPDDGVVSWIAHDAAKPGRMALGRHALADTFVAHAIPA